jgi:putative membrane-bound dehydrogenase-like protein
MKRFQPGLIRMVPTCMVFFSLGAWAWADDAAKSKTADDAAKPKMHEVRLNGHVFTLPESFEIELAAGPPLVDRPITADFDEQGRLYVSDSSGSNEKVEEQLKKKPHRILRIEAENGKFVRRTVFADHMMFPEGTMWYAGSLYVSAPPSIWKLTDTKGDGVADQRVEWFQGKTLTGCANDLHGPYLGPDGWIYWCKGAFAKQTYERPGKPPLVTRAAHIFRSRPDGSGIEPVMTGGMDNPVDVVFTQGGERIFTTTFLQHPGGGKRDGLIHAVYGGIYGKDHDVIYDHPWTSPSLMPVMTHLGAAAPCGLTRYDSGAFGPEFRDNLFACLFNMHKVTRHVLIPDGATFKTRDEDFLVSNNLDFHPTDIIEDADGSLLVVDTGGWYKLCCPTSQLHKPDILGAIYRIRKKDMLKIADYPRGSQIDWAKLPSRDVYLQLTPMAPAVRRRAAETLVSRGAEAVKAMADQRAGSLQIRREQVWVATRIDHPSARAYVRHQLDDEDEIVRQAAMNSISLWRDREAVPDLVKMLRGSLPNRPSAAELGRNDPFAPVPPLANRRAAAEALGRIGDPAAVPDLLPALGESKDSKYSDASDQVFQHSLTYALIEIGDAKKLAAYLDNENPRIRRGVLTAMDQIKDGGLNAEIISKNLDSPDRELKETAWWIAGRHPEWGGTLAGYFRKRLDAKEISQSDKEDLIRRMARFSSAEPVQVMLIQLLQDSAATSATKQLVLHAMAESKLKKVPESWMKAWTSILEGDDQDQIGETVKTIRALTNPKEPAKALIKPLLKVGENEKLPAHVRLTALTGVPGGLPEVDAKIFAFLLKQLDPELPAATRALATEALAQAKLTSPQLIELAHALKSAGPLELDRLMEAFGQSQDEQAGLELITSLKASPVRSSLRTETLTKVLAKYPVPVQQYAKGLYAAIEADKSQQLSKLEHLLANLKQGEIRRGQAVFMGTKASCSACHAIGYLGGNVGPDLTHIGKIRSERDLLESIVFPSASFVRSYEPVVVTTKDGKAINGLIRKDGSDEITLATGINQEVRVARKDIEDIQPSRVSIMPAGLDQQLSPQELADLVAFLKACQ